MEQNFGMKTMTIKLLSIRKPLTDPSLKTTRWENTAETREVPFPTPRTLIPIFQQQTDHYSMAIGENYSSS
jgi:hypothetical protein